MKPLLVTQRIDRDARTGERRDALDLRWAPFLAHCGFACFPVPNFAAGVAAALATVRPCGIVLSGGNDLARYGGDAPERDATERALLEAALAHGLPVLGVCRGMQFIQDHLGVPLERVEGHVATARDLHYRQVPQHITCYHRFGSRTTVPGLQVDAVAADGVIEAVSAGDRVRAVMWHPERNPEPDPMDVHLIRTLFS